MKADTEKQLFLSSSGKTVCHFLSICRTEGKIQSLLLIDDTDKNRYHNSSKIIQEEAALMKLKNHYKPVRSALAKYGIIIGKRIADTANLFDVTTINGYKTRTVCCKVFMHSSPAEVEREYQTACKCYEYAPEHFMRVYGQPVPFIAEDTAEGYQKNGYAILMEKGTPFTFAPGPKYVSFYVKLLRDICLAAKAVHSMGYIHMDIKPDNIVINSHGNYCLIDFGISKTISGAVDLYDLSGSRYFTAPEIFRGELSPQADIYGIGMTLRFVMMNGIFEFPEYLADIPRLYRHKKELVPLGSEDGYTHRFLDIINKAAAFDPQNRYQNIDEILADLSKIPIEENVRFYSRCYEYDENEAV